MEESSLQIDFHIHIFVCIRGNQEKKNSLRYMVKNFLSGCWARNIGEGLSVSTVASEMQIKLPSSLLLLLLGLPHLTQQQVLFQSSKSTASRCLFHIYYYSEAKLCQCFWVCQNFVNPQYINARRKNSGWQAWWNLVYI